MTEIRMKTKEAFREELIKEFSTPANREYKRIVISRWAEGHDWHVYSIDLTAIGDDRRCFVGIRAFDEETKEYFFIEI